MTGQAEEFHVDLVDWQAQQAALLKVRHQVFVIEQKVPKEEEEDGKDDTAIHALARDKTGSPIGTGRFLPDGKIGRMAVLAPWRSRGVGERILKTLLAEVQRLGHSRIELSAQVAAIPFYQRHGFTAYGERYMDAGIPHRMMEIDLTTKK